MNNNTNNPTQESKTKVYNSHKSNNTIRIKEISNDNDNKDNSSGVNNDNKVLSSDAGDDRIRGDEDRVHGVCDSDRVRGGSGSGGDRVRGNSGRDSAPGDGNGGGDKALGDDNTVSIITITKTLKDGDMMDKKKKDDNMMIERSKKVSDGGDLILDEDNIKDDNENEKQNNQGKSMKKTRVKFNIETMCCLCKGMLLKEVIFTNKLCDHDYCTYCLDEFTDHYNYIPSRCPLKKCKHKIDSERFNAFKQMQLKKIKTEKDDNKSYREDKSYTDDKAYRGNKAYIEDKGYIDDNSYREDKANRRDKSEKNYKAYREDKANKEDKAHREYKGYTEDKTTSEDKQPYHQMQQLKQQLQHDQPQQPKQQQQQQFEQQQQPEKHEKQDRNNDDVIMINQRIKGSDENKKGLGSRGIKPIEEMMLCEKCNMNKRKTQIFWNKICEHHCCVNCLQKIKHPLICSIKKCNMNIDSKSYKDFMNNVIIHMDEDIYDKLELDCKECGKLNVLKIAKGSSLDYFKCENCLGLICYRHNELMKKCLCYCPECISDMVTWPIIDEKWCKKCKRMFCGNCRKMRNEIKNPCSCKCLLCLDKKLNPDARFCDKCQINQNICHNCFDENKTDLFNIQTLECKHNICQRCIFQTLDSKSFKTFQYQAKSIPYSSCPICKSR